MRIYLAGSYSRREELLGYAGILEANGHTVTSSWLKGEHSEHDADIGRGIDPSLARSFAEQDIEDIRTSDVMISFTGGSGEGNHRGGRHVEFGIAIERALLVGIVGPYENVFHYRVRRTDTFDEMLPHINEMRR